MSAETVADTASNALTAALAYADRGWHVFPVKARGKTPITKNGQDDATTDRELIRNTWEQHPAANIGIHCEPSRLYVVDIDTGSGKVGAQSWASLLDQHGQHPATFTVRTASGGTHYYFTVSAGLAASGRLRNTASKVGEHIDTRWNGYVVAPPSTGAAGPYTVTDDTEPAELPEWIISAQEPKRRPGSRPAAPAVPTGVAADAVIERVRALSAELAELPEGSGNDGAARLAFKAGQYVGAGQITAGDAARIMLDGIAGWTFRTGHGFDAMVNTIEKQIQAGSAEPRAWEQPRAVNRPTRSVPAQQATVAPAGSAPIGSEVSLTEVQVPDAPTDIDYRGADGTRFRQYAAGHSTPARVVQVDQKDDRETERRILLGELRVTDLYALRGITADCTPSDGASGTVYAVEFTAPGASPRVDRIFDTDLRATRDLEWPGHLGIDPYTSTASLKRVPDVIRAMALDRQEREAYAAAGLLLRQGRRPAFLRPGGPALTADPAQPDYELVTQMPVEHLDETPGLHHLRLADPSTAEQAAADWAAWWDVRLIAMNDDQLVPLLLIALTCSAPMSSLPGLVTPAVYLDAPTGSGKSALTGLITGWQSASFVPTAQESSAVVMSAESMSSVGARSVLHVYRGHVIAVDDFFPKGQSPQDTAKQVALLNTIGRGTRSGAADIKGRRDGSLRTGKAMRAVPLVTGEAFTDPRSSQSARFVHARLTADTLALTTLRADGRRNDALDVAQATVRAAARAHSSMICDALADIDAVRAAAQRASDDVLSWRLPGNSHLPAGYTALMMGAHLFAERGGRLGIADPAQIIAEFADAFRRCATEQGTSSIIRNAVAEAHGDDVATIIGTLRRLILEGTWRIDGPEIGTPPTVPGYAVAAFGWRRIGGEMGTDVPLDGLGQPIGTVHTYAPGNAGRPPAWPARARVDGAVLLKLKVDDFSRIYDTTVAKAGGSMYLPTEDQARKILADAGYLQSPEAKAGPRGAARSLTLDLGRLLDGADGADGDGDDSRGGLATPPGGIGDGIGDVTESLFSQVNCVGDVGDVGDAGTPVEQMTAGQPEVQQPCRRCGETADPVAVRETGGFHIGCAPGAEDCPRCGLHVADGVRERFEGYHAACAPTAIRDAGMAATAALRAAQGGERAAGQPQGARSPFGRQRGAQGRQEAQRGPIVPLATQVEDFRRNVLRDLGAELTENEAAEALAKFSAALDGLEFHGWWGQTGADAYAMVCARDGLAGRGVAMVEQVPGDQAALVQSFSNDTVLHRDHISDQPAPELGAWITELDINAQFPTAAGGLELGHGAPTHLATVRSVEGLLRGAVPGYLRLAAPLTVTAQQLPATHSAWREIEAGRVLTLNHARWLAKHGVQIDAGEALIWPDHRRHLRTWSELFRIGRERLKADPSPAARVALGALKMTANTTVGGWLKSQKNHGDLLRPDFTDQIITESWVRAMAAVEKAGREGDLTLGMRRDSAWWVADHGPFTPRGLTVSEQGGKWKHSRWAQVDTAIREAHATGVADTLNRAIKAAHENREGEQK